MIQNLSNKKIGFIDLHQVKDIKKSFKHFLSLFKLIKHIKKAKFYLKLLMF